MFKPVPEADGARIQATGVVTLRTVCTRPAAVQLVVVVAAGEWDDVDGRAHPRGFEDVSGALDRAQVYRDMTLETDDVAWLALVPRDAAGLRFSQTKTLRGSWPGQVANPERRTQQQPPASQQLVRHRAMAVL